ncbi:mariner transposase [Trichonephila clavipes]|nr:mariner transposase [Trichonephila clavipes]
MDETWIYYNTLESKRSSVEWTAAGESCAKRSKTQTSSGTVMATVFWDAYGILLIEYLEKGELSSSEYYMALLDQLNEKNKGKTSSNAKEKKCCFTKTMLHATSPRKGWLN